MRLLVLRHAKAEESFEGDDFDRPLSQEGKNDEAIVIDFLKKHDFSVERIITSPLKRARETSDILQEAFPSSHVEIEPSLGDKFDAEIVLKSLQNSQDTSCQAIVGHAPSLGFFINRLLGNGNSLMSLSKSSVAIIEFDNSIEYGKGHFVGYFTKNEMLSQIP